VHYEKRLCELAFFSQHRKGLGSPNPLRCFLYDEKATILLKENKRKRRKRTLKRPDKIDYCVRLRRLRFLRYFYAGSIK
jgi:hypothetical protein